MKHQHDTLVTSVSGKWLLIPSLWQGLPCWITVAWINEVLSSYGLQMAYYLRPIGISDLEEELMTLFMRVWQHCKWRLTGVWYIKWKLTKWSWLREYIWLWIVNVLINEWLKWNVPGQVSLVAYWGVVDQVDHTTKGRPVLLTTRYGL